MQKQGYVSLYAHDQVTNLNPSSRQHVTEIVQSCNKYALVGTEFLSIFAVDPHIIQTLIIIPLQKWGSEIWKSTTLLDHNTAILIPNLEAEEQLKMFKGEDQIPGRRSMVFFIQREQ